MYLNDTLFNEYPFSSQIYPTNKIELKSGDLMGFMTEGIGSIAYQDGGEEVVVKDLGSSSRPKQGEVVSLTDIVNRTFSFSVTVGKSNVTCTSVYF